MNFEEIRRELAEHYPQWSRLIDVVEFQDVIGVQPVENDGRSIYFNGKILRYFTPEIQTFYMAQQLVHIQLAHHQRGLGRDRAVWKKATDAWVNAMLKRDGFELPQNVSVMEDAADKSVEELYDLLYEDRDEDQEQDPDAEEEPQSQQPVPEIKSKTPGTEAGARDREIDEPGIADVVAGLADMLEPSMQLDFDWFPGDTIRDGMLLYQFKPYAVPHAEILLDTSASVDADLLRSFVRGVKGLLQSNAVVRVGCFDTSFYGWQDVRNETDIQNLELRGAGGTDFKVAVNAFTGDAETRIIFTDGYAEMPEQRCDAIWVVYSDMPIHPNGGRVIYAKKPEEREKYEVDFLIT